MRVLFQLSALALRQFAGPGSDATLNALADRFGDRSSRLLDTLKLANTHAWKAVEIALAGSSWWDRCKRIGASGDQYAFRGQVQAFLDAHPLDEAGTAGQDFRRACLAELKAARADGLLPGEDLENPGGLPRTAHALARFDDPKALLDAEFASVRTVADDLRAAGYGNLGRLVALRPPGGRPLIVIAVEYFFRKAVTGDPALAAEMQLHELQKLSEQQEAGFGGLHLALAEHADRLEGLLGSALELLEGTHALARETRDDVKALREEMATDRASLAQVYQAVLRLLEQTPAVAAPVAAASGPAAAEPPEPPEDAIAEMRTLVENLEHLPAAEKTQHRALFRAVGHLGETVRAYDARRQMRKGVLPSELFTGPAADEPVSVPAAPDPDEHLPLAEELEEPAPGGDPAPQTVASIFGELPKPKLLRKPGNPRS